jgi:hypothetical protein
VERLGSHAGALLLFVCGQSAEGGASSAIEGGSVGAALTGGGDGSLNFSMPRHCGVGRIGVRLPGGVFSTVRFALYAGGKTRRGASSPCGTWMIRRPASWRGGDCARPADANAAISAAAAMAMADFLVTG